MIFDKFSSKMSGVYRIAYIRIACIYSYFLDNLYVPFCERFLSNVVSKKRDFSSCTLFVINSINILLQKTGKTIKTGSRRETGEGKTSVYTCISVYTLYDIQRGFWG